MSDKEKKERLETLIAVVASLTLITFLIAYPHLKFGFYPPNDLETRYLKGKVKKVTTRIYSTIDESTGNLDSSVVNTETETHYDSLGYRLQETTLVGGKTIDKKFGYTYDGKGRVIKIEVDSDESKLEVEYDYDDSLRTRSQELMVGTVEFEKFNAKNKLEDWYRISGQDTILRSILEYDDQQRIVKSEVHVRGELQQILTVNYVGEDEIHYQMRSVEDNSIDSTKMVYDGRDKYGNWSKAERYVNGKQEALMLFTYEYYNN